MWVNLLKRTPTISIGCPFQKVTPTSSEKKEKEKTERGSGVSAGPLGSTRNRRTNYVLKSAIHAIHPEVAFRDV